MAGPQLKKPVKARKQPCINPDCGSSDGMEIYEDGRAHCYSCKGSFRKEQVEDMDDRGYQPQRSSPRFGPRGLELEEIQAMRSKGNQERGISTKVTEFFGVKTAYKDDGKTQRARCYPYPSGGYNVRELPKSFYRVGPKLEGLFGQDKFGPGGKRLVITTGEEDAMAMAEASDDKYGEIYPVVSIGSDNNMALLLQEREYVRSFGEVVLMFDQDGSGKEALAQAIKIVGIDKVKIAHLPEKDANATLLKHGGKALLHSMFDAAPYTPGGFLSRDELWEKLEADLAVQSIPFPDCLAGVNKKTRGKRLGDITLFISGTGSGKSTLVREDALYDLQNHLPKDEKIGWIALEEGPGESVRKFAGMALNKNPAAQEEPMTLEELKPGFDEVFGSDQIIVLDHQGSMNDAGLIEKMEWLCLKGCTRIYLDHITIAASEGFEGKDGNEAVDKLMAALLRLVKRYPLWIGLISHLRKVPGGTGKSFEEGRLPSLDDIKGSGSIKQISMDIIAFARNMRSADSFERNKVLMEVLKCRYTGLTGPVQGAHYDYPTGRLHLDNSKFDKESGVWVDRETGETLHDPADDEEYAQ